MQGWIRLNENEVWCKLNKDIAYYMDMIKEQ